MKQESLLKSKLMEALKVHLPGYHFFRHEDVRTSGIPDISATGGGRTSWWEVKHGDPKFDSTGLQELTMLRLAGAGYARYILYLEDKDGLSPRTLIVHPRYLHDLMPEVQAVGFDHRFVAEFIRKVHQPMPG